jgi:hypothetical protein
VIIFISMHRLVMERVSLLGNKRWAGEVHLVEWIYYGAN